MHGVSIFWLIPKYSFMTVLGFFVFRIYWERGMRNVDCVFDDWFMWSNSHVYRGYGSVLQ